MASNPHGQSRRNWRRSGLWFFLALVAVILFVAKLSGRYLGSTNFPDGTQVVLQLYTHATFHEFGQPDLRKRLQWIPAGVWNAIGYKPGFHAIIRENEPCTILWMRVKWKPERQEPIPSDLNVQSVEPDGTAYHWDLVSVYQSGPNELILPYRARALRPPGGRLKVRIVEEITQRTALQGHLGDEWQKRNADRRPPAHQMTSFLTLPNPVKSRSNSVNPLPLPQSQERDGLEATLQSIQTKPLDDGEFSVGAKFQLLWHGAEEPGGFAYYYSISTPQGEAADFRRWSSFIDRQPDDTQSIEQMARAPMRGYQAWLLNLHIISTASFPEFENERGIPLFTAPVAARWKTGKDNPQAPVPTVSPEASDAGFGIIDVWPPRALRLIVHRAPAPWFPTDWTGSDPLPFVVVAEADGKRVSLRSSGSGGGYGQYGLARYDFSVTEAPQQLAFGMDWRLERNERIVIETDSVGSIRTARIQTIPESERPKLPETIEYRLIPRHYWKFTFPVAPVDPPIR
jgi:hypothetical protein